MMRSGEKHSRLWRAVYLIEVLVLAVPTLLPMGLLALVGTIYCGLATLIGLERLPGNISGRFNDTDETMQFVVLGSLGTLVCLAALYSISRFVTLSRAYFFGSTSELLAHARDFRIGLILSLALLALNGSLAMTIWEEIAGVFALLALANVLVMVPVTHLWLALRKAERATISQTA